MCDWQVGDLALCVNNGSIVTDFGTVVSSPELLVGRPYTVVEVRHRGLILAERPILKRNPVSGRPWGGYAKIRFIKVTPEEADDFDATVIYELNYAPSPAFTGED